LDFFGQVPVLFMEKLSTSSHPERKKKSECCFGISVFCLRFYFFIESGLSSQSEANTLHILGRDILKKKENLGFKRKKSTAFTARVTKLVRKKSMVWLNIYLYRVTLGRKKVRFYLLSTYFYLLYQTHTTYLLQERARERR